MNKRDAKHWFQLGTEAVEAMFKSALDDTGEEDPEKYLEQCFDKAWEKEKSIRKKVKEG